MWILLVVVVLDVVRGVVGLLAKLLSVVVGRCVVVVFLVVVVDTVVEEDLDEGDFWMRSLVGLFLDILFHHGNADIVLVLRIEKVVVELVAKNLK
jgi:hypothetical protein